MVVEGECEARIVNWISDANGNNGFYGFLFVCQVPRADIKVLLLSNNK